MYHIERAIIMAAGIGTRMQPLTLKTPKPLIEVNGKKMIESVIDALHYNGIFEIYIVVGYLKNQFNYLLEKYDGIVLIENPLYKICNNISSLYFAKDYIENAIILDGDQIINNFSVLNPDFKKSGYNAVWTDSFTNEWLMQVENNKVISCSRDGGSCGWQLFSVSRWNSEDGKKLKKYLIEEFELKNNTQIYWDDVAMFCHFSDFDLGIFEMSYNDVIEFDSVEDLKAFDNRYE